MVKPVNRCNASFAEKLRKPQHGTRPLSMEMNNVISAESCLYCSKNGRAYSGKPALLNGKNTIYADTVIFGEKFAVKFLSAYVMSSSVIAGHVVTQLCHSFRKLSYNNLHSALT